jgi:hypothetical protein
MRRPKLNETLILKWAKQGESRLTIRQIVEWADQHRKRTGDWPTRTSGPIHKAPGETWGAIQTALQHGLRGLPGGDSLPKVLNRYRGRPAKPGRGRKLLRRLSVPEILKWADAYYRRHGRWPSQGSGPVEGVSGISWVRIDVALRMGTSGLPSGQSLAKLLRKDCGECETGTQLNDIKLSCISSLSQAFT